MKKYLQTIIASSIITLSSSCKKENTTIVNTESSSQRLTKITQIIPLNETNTYSEIINFEYDAQGNLIREGDETYSRDNLHRIAEVNNKKDGGNRTHTNVYYNKANPTQVEYTYSEWSGRERGADSVIYIHNESGQLIKTMTYVHQAAGNYLDTSNYYQYSLNDSTWLSKFNVFTYDGNGNIIKIVFYSVNSKGETVVCGVYSFEEYDKSINPQYATDEVRTADYTFAGVLNTSKNNFLYSDHLSKIYAYRNDGRPRSCVVNQNGVKAFTLLFEYD